MYDLPVSKRTIRLRHNLEEGISQLSGDVLAKAPPQQSMATILRDGPRPHHTRAAILSSLSQLREGTGIELTSALDVTQRQRMPLNESLFTQDIGDTSIRFERRRKWYPEVIGFVVERRLATKTAHCPPGSRNQHPAAAASSFESASTVPRPQQAWNRDLWYSSASRGSGYTKLTCAREPQRLHTLRTHVLENSESFSGSWSVARILRKNPAYLRMLPHRTLSASLPRLPSSRAMDRETLMPGATTLLKSRPILRHQDVDPYPGIKHATASGVPHRDIPGSHPRLSPIPPIAQDEAVRAGPIGESHCAAALGCADEQACHSRSRTHSDVCVCCRRARARLRHDPDRVDCGDMKSSSSSSCHGARARFRGRDTWREREGIGARRPPLVGQESSPPGTIPRSSSRGPTGSPRRTRNWLYSGGKIHGGEGLQPATTVHFYKKGHAPAVVHLDARGNVMRGDAELEDEPVRDALLADGDGGGEGRRGRGAPGSQNVCKGEPGKGRRMGRTTIRPWLHPLALALLYHAAVPGLDSASQVA
ncbi:hypothetical protein DFH09DRAFT_1283265 [Mycena vulgaris]|nr:hypothetical protein DFH09DRAFT_1283265 [Mycena vulgaris]